MKDKENKKPLPDKATAEEMRKEYDFSKARKNPYIKKKYSLHRLAFPGGGFYFALSISL